MAAYEKFQQFVEDLAHGVHDLETDVLQVALCAAANAPVAGNAVLADLTQIDYTNCSTQVITTSTSGQATGTYDLVLTDLTLTAGGGPVAAFRYVVVFNQSSATPDDALICFFDYGSDLVLADGESLTIDFESDGPTTGSLLTLA
jgi:hypothetical protein